MSRVNIPYSTIKSIQKIFSSKNTLGMPNFSEIPDPRKKQGQRHGFSYMLKCLFGGMLMSYSTLEALEAFTIRRGKTVSDGVAIATDKFHTLREKTFNNWL